MNYPAHAYPITIPQGEDYSKTWTYYPNGTDAAVHDRMTLALTLIVLAPLAAVIAAQVRSLW